MAEFLRIAAIVTLILIASKSIIGYHFPWEKCECCGKKYRDHKVRNKNV